jgi:gamma-glutamyltranspeptidase/glutathione hydrolase
MAKGKGFVLNDAMADFSPKAGVKTTQGLAYGEANAVRGGKTPLSSMAPVLVFKDGKPFMAVGAAGGPRIITGTLQAIFNVLEYGMMMDEAIKSPYISCLTQEQGLELEPGFSPDTVALLERKGHKIMGADNGFVLKTMVNGVMIQDGFFYPCGAARIDGCGGALLKDGNIALDGMIPAL